MLNFSKVTQRLWNLTLVKGFPWKKNKGWARNHGGHLLKNAHVRSNSITFFSPHDMYLKESRKIFPKWKNKNEIQNLTVKKKKNLLRGDNCFQFPPHISLSYIYKNTLDPLDGPNWKKLIPSSHKLSLN